MRKNIVRKKKKIVGFGEKAKETEEEEEGAARLSKCTMYFSAEYEDFAWVIDCPQKPVSFDECCRYDWDGELMELPQLDHVNDNVFGESGIALDDFVTKFMVCAKVEAENFIA